VIYAQLVIERTKVLGIDDVGVCVNDGDKKFSVAEESVDVEEKIIKNSSFTKKIL
jgi:hypothetical protein